MVDTMIYYNITIFPFHNFFVTYLVLCWCVLQTGFELTGLVIILIPWVCVTTSGEVYSSWVPIHTLGFFRLFVLSWVWHLFTALLYFWTNDFRLTDDGRLFPSLYLLWETTEEAVDAVMHVMYEPSIITFLTHNHTYMLPTMSKIFSFFGRNYKIIFLIL